MEELKELLKGMTIDVDTNFGRIIINDSILKRHHPDALLNLFLELKKIQSE